MSIKFRLTNNEFPILRLGAWLITVCNYWSLQNNGVVLRPGAIFSTLGISIIMPAIKVLLHKWINAEKLYGILHI
jgi:hypothetical protein